MLGPAPIPRRIGLRVAARRAREPARIAAHERTNPGDHGGVSRARQAARGAYRERSAGLIFVSVLPEFLQYLEETRGAILALACHAPWAEHFYDLVSSVISMESWPDGQGSWARAQNRAQTAFNYV